MLRRTGTLGLWQALKTLGYKPFHISELLPYGFQQMRALQEAIIANDTDKPFGRAEFDKLFAGYDVSDYIHNLGSVTRRIRIDQLKPSVLSRAPAICAPPLSRSIWKIPTSSSS